MLIRSAFSAENMIMKILVNGENLPFELDEVLPIESVIEKVAVWARSQNAHILDYRIKARTGFENADVLNSEQTELIDIELGNAIDLISGNLNELDAYLDRMGVFLADKISEGKNLNARELEEVSSGIEYIRQVVSELNDKLGQDAGEEVENSLISLSASTDLMVKIQSLAVIKNQTGVWMRKVKFGALTAEEKTELKAKFLEKVPETESALEKIASLLTMGKESEALQKLEYAMEIISDGLVLLSMTGYPDAEKISSTLKLMSELTAALDSSDMVTAADIIDFDLRESLSKLAVA